MNKNKIIELVKILKNSDYKDVFGALIVFEKLDYLYNLKDLNDGDIEYLEKVYDKFMNSPTMSGLLNEELNEILESGEEPNYER